MLYVNYIPEMLKNFFLIFRNVLEKENRKVQLHAVAPGCSEEGSKVGQGEAKIFLSWSRFQTNISKRKEISQELESTVPGTSMLRSPQPSMLAGVSGIDEEMDPISQVILPSLYPAWHLPSPLSRKGG